MQANILEAKNRLSQLIKIAQAGGEVIIANRGEPVVALVSTTPNLAASSFATSAKIGSAEAILAWLDKNPLPQHRLRNHDEIEAAISAERNAWD